VGGAQGLAILATVGAAKTLDCPHCRDPQHPRAPIYTHIGHTAKKPVRRLLVCIFERGLNAVRQVTHDPAFQGFRMNSR